jgi:hypothetical protein
MGLVVEILRRLLCEGSKKVYFCIFVTDKDTKQKLVEITLEPLFLYFFVAKDITPLAPLINPLSLSK